MSVIHEAKTSLSSLETRDTWNWSCHTTQKNQGGVANFFPGFPRKVEWKKTLFFFPKSEWCTQVYFPLLQLMQLLFISSYKAIHRISAANCDMNFPLGFLHRDMKFSSNSTTCIYLRNEGKQSFSTNISHSWDHLLIYCRPGFLGSFPSSDWQKMSG